MLRRSVGFGDMSAVVALLARVSGVDQDHGDTGQRCLVGDKLPQLGKAPVGVSWPLLASGLNPLPDACQVFQADSGSGALRRVHETFRNGVVRVGLKPFLLARQQAQLSACRSGVVLLKTLAPPGKALPCMLNIRTAVDRPIRINRKIDYAEVYTKDTLNPDRFWLKDITDHGKVEDASNIHQIDFAFAVRQQGALSCATLIGNRQPTLGTPQRDLGVRAESEDAVIVGLGSIALETPPFILIKLVGISHLPNAPYYHLRGKQELLATGVVGQRMQRELPKRLRVPCLASQPRTRTIRRCQRLKQRSVLGWSRHQFEVRHKFHVSSIDELMLRIKQELPLRRGNLSFLSALNGGVFRTED